MSFNFILNSIFEEINLLWSMSMFTIGCSVSADTCIYKCSKTGKQRIPVCKVYALLCSVKYHVCIFLLVLFLNTVTFRHTFGNVTVTLSTLPAETLILIAPNNNTQACKQFEHRSDIIKSDW